MNPLTAIRSIFRSRHEVSDPVTTAQITRAGIGDEGAGLILQPVTPDRARWIIESARQGDLQAQDELFGLMLDTWPRLAKAVEELKGAVQRLRWEVKPASRKGAEPSQIARDYADTVDDALVSIRAPLRRAGRCHPRR